MLRFALTLAFLAPSAGAWAQDLAPQTAAQQEAGAPVIYGRDTLFLIHTRLGPFSPQDRAAAVAQRLAQIAEERRGDSVRVIVEDGTSQIAVGGVIVTSVTDADAARAGIGRDSLAAERARIIARALERSSLLAVLKTVALGLLFTLIATVVLVVILKVLNRAFPALYAKLESWRGTRIPALRIQRLELLSASRMTDALITAARTLRVVVVAILLFYYVPLVFRFFPWTENFGSALLGYAVAPIRQVGRAVLGYIPNLFYIAVIVAVTHYLLKFIRLLFDGLERGTIRFSGFYEEWARPTYNIVRFLVLAFALVVIFPYLPGAGSDAFKGVSVFVGILVSLGSAGAISNVIAGVVITYMRPFKVGDRVRIADTEGDVIERTLLVTRVRTPKNVDISIPNAMVLGSHITNYSSTAKEGGVILHTSVTIGYDAPWQKVHELLLSAAARTEGVLKEPAPFVLQTALNDFYVTYELNVYNESPNKMQRIYSDLHRHIQDTFNEAGVEIMSPHYSALRDGNQTTIPESYLPKEYQAPAFRLFSLDAGTHRGAPGGAP
ncbi:MAG TPA: mechanosensitive ion channel family protein [Gemmatimonadales bacterium]|jgi:small-conductance mechanosensitive channel|nr:mechanosensitive ion channel family protein [Gemmatimonadales bacterium]